MKNKMKNYLYTIGSFVLLVLIVLSFLKLNEESKETRKWLEEVNEELQYVENEEYAVKKLVSIKYPAMDELKSLSIAFFKDEVNHTKIRIIEALVEVEGKDKFVTIIAEVNNTNKLENLRKVSGVLIKNKDNRDLIVNSYID